MQGQVMGAPRARDGSRISQWGAASIAALVLFLSLALAWIAIGVGQSLAPPAMEAGFVSPRYPVASDEAFLATPAQGEWEARDRLSQCEREAGVLGDRLAAQGIDIRTQNWQNNRQRSIRACAQQFSDFRWLLNDR